MRSKLGWTFAAIYAVVFAAAYADYLRHAGTWMADLGLNVLALPYVLAGRLFTLDRTFELHGFQPWGLAPAMTFCAALAYFVGLAVERLFHRLRSKESQIDEAGR